MGIFVNWWRNRWLKHIEQTITHENIRINAEDKGLVPQITLSWRIVNRSMTKVTISKIFGDLYIGAWRVGTFGTDSPLQKQYSSSWSPVVSITQKVLKKGNQPGSQATIEIVLFPSLEFWLAQNYTCALYNAMVEVKSFWGIALSTVSKENIKVENAESVFVRYREHLKTRLTSVLQ
jgi:hypothetical protein